MSKYNNQSSDDKQESSSLAGSAVEGVNLKQLAQLMNMPKGGPASNIPATVIGTDIDGLNMAIPVPGKEGFPSTPTSALNVLSNQLLGRLATDSTLLNGRDTEVGLSSEIRAILMEVLYAPHSMGTYKVVTDSAGNVNYSQVTGTDIQIVSDAAGSDQKIHYDKQYIDALKDNDQVLNNALATFALNNNNFIDLLVSTKNSGVPVTWKPYGSLISIGNTNQTAGLSQIQLSGQTLILQSYRMALLNAMTFIHQWKNVQASIEALILKMPKKSSLLSSLKGNMMRSLFTTTIKNIEGRIFGSYVDYDEWMRNARYWGLFSSHSKGNDTPLLVPFITMSRFTDYKFTTTANSQLDVPLSALETVVDHSALMPDPNVMRAVIEWVTNNDGSSGTSPNTFLSNLMKPWERWAQLFGNTFATVDSAFSSLTTYPSNGTTININWTQRWSYELDRYAKMDINYYAHLENALETAGYANPTYIVTTSGTGQALRDVYGLTIQYNTSSVRNELFNDEGYYDRFFSVAAKVQAISTGDDPYRLSKIAIGQTYINLFNTDKFITNLRVASTTTGTAIQLVVDGDITQPGNADAIASDLLRFFTSVQLVDTAFNVLGTLSRPENLIQGTGFMSNIFTYKDSLFALNASCIRPVALNTH